MQAACEHTKWCLHPLFLSLPTYSLAWHCFTPLPVLCRFKQASDKVILTMNSVFMVLCVSESDWHLPVVLNLNFCVCVHVCIHESC